MTMHGDVEVEGDGMEHELPGVTELGKSVLGSEFHSEHKYEFGENEYLAVRVRVRMGGMMSRKILILILARLWLRLGMWMDRCGRM